MTADKSKRAGSRYAVNSSSRSRRAVHGWPRRSSAPSNNMSYKRTNTGYSACIAAVTFLRPSRCCNALKLAASPPCTSPRTSNSPSTTPTPLNAAAISGNAPVTSSPPRLNKRVSPPVDAIWIRMPSHFHSATNSSRCTLPSSSGCASMKGRKNALSAGSGRAVRLSPHAKSSAYGGRSACHTSSTSSTDTPKACPKAVLARRADIPTRMPPVASFSSA